MSYLLPHLHKGWAVDQAILAEEERLVVIRFGHDWDETCMQVPPSPNPNFTFDFLSILFFINSLLVALIIICNSLKTTLIILDNCF